MNGVDKINFGQFFTVKDKWLLPQIARFIKSCSKTKCIDPFAGRGDLFKALELFNFSEFLGYDIYEKNGWLVNDSLISIPKHKDTLLVTNPPYLSKNSAKRQNLSNYSYFNNNDYVDLYQIAIDKALSVYDSCIFIIPETYIRSTFFKHHVNSITIVEDSPFEDTDCPVCVVCFKYNKDIFKDINYDIFKNEVFLLEYKELEYRLLKYSTKTNLKMDFNNKEGNLGVRAVDGTNPNDRIMFCAPKDLNYDLGTIKNSSRAITVVDVSCDIDDRFLFKSNELLEDFRMRTYDLTMAPFKNNNKNNKRRRRLDFATARMLINKTYELLN
jgi:hypothetical protein